MRTKGIPLIAALAFTAGMPVLPASAQSYPSRSVRIVVPVTPGGGVDIVGRTLAENVQKQNAGVTVIVENRTGAGGNVGSGSVHIRRQMVMTSSS